MNKRESDVNTVLDSKYMTWMEFLSTYSPNDKLTYHVEKFSQKEKSTVTYGLSS